MSQSISSKPKIEKAKFSWELVILPPIWLVFAYYSVAFPHKTFHLYFLEAPMTPLLLFFTSSLIYLIYMVIDKEDFGTALIVSLVVSFLVFLPLPIAWGLLSFYEVNPFPSFLAILIVPAILLQDELRVWSNSRKTRNSSKTVEGIRGMSKPFKLIGFYASGLFFGYGTIISLSYLFCYFTNQSFDMFAKTNPAVILLGGATIMAGILALSKPSR